MPAAAFIGPLIGAAGSIGGSLIGSSAAKSAGNQLNQMGIQVGQSIDKATGGAIQSGYNALTQGNEWLNNALANATGSIRTGYGDAAGALRGGLTDATGAIRSGLQDASSAVAGNYGAANEALGRGYSDQMAALAPYLAAGGQGLSQLQAFLAPGGAGTKQFDASMMASQDPGYQFRLAEGAKALEGSAGARGALLGGATQKALSRYSQDYASNEYQNAWDRYTKGQLQQFGMLSGLAGFGQHATDQAVGAAGDLARGVSQNFGNVGNLLGQMNYGAGSQIGNLNYGAGTQLANYGYGAGHDIAQANLGVGGQLANNAMQGNEWIGNVGLQGAQEAGNAYMQGKLGQASGNLSSGNYWAQGLNNAGQMIGGALWQNQQNQQNQQPNVFQLPNNGYGMITPPTVIDPGSLGPAPTIAYNPPQVPNYWALSAPPAYNG